MPKTKVSYQGLSAELDQVLAALQNPEVRIDEAAALYERGLKIIKQLEIRIVETENRITALKSTGDRRIK